MDADQTLKILKMVQEGFLTPEQGQRLIQELIAGAATGAGAGASDSRPTRARSARAICRFNSRRQSTAPRTPSQ